MNDELRSEPQAEMGGGGKIRKNPFFCPTYLSAILPLVSSLSLQSNGQVMGY
jgi:hypothetical protein